MISGAHVLTYSSNSEADAAFLRDVLALSHVDAGEGFLIFGLPQAEMAMHGIRDGHGTPGKSEVHLVVESIEKFVASMQEKSIATDPIADQGWGMVSSVMLPSGIKLGVYEPRHARPESGQATGAVKAAAKAAKKAKKAAKALRATAKAVKKATKKASKAAKKASKAKKHK